MLFEDIKVGSVVRLRDGTVVVATVSHLQQDSDFIIAAWETTGGVELITRENFLGFEVV